MDLPTLKRLHDAHVACREITGFTNAKDFDAFVNDRGLQLIVQRLMEIVGEAVNQALRHNPTIASSFPNAHVIVSMRNRIIHGYDQLINRVIWDTAINDIPVLAGQLATFLAEYGDG